MADSTGPFGTADWAEADWYDFAPIWSQSGVIGSPATAATTGSLAFASSGLSVSAAAGRAWARGAGFKRTGSPPTHAVTANSHASWSRRDRLVLRRDLANHVVTTAVIQGTPAATPTAPALTQVETGVWETPLVSFLAPPNSGTALTGVLDERAWIDPTGQVSVYGDAGLAALAVGAAPGTRAYHSSTKRFYRLDGSTWVYDGGAPPAIVACTPGGGWEQGPRQCGAYKDASGLIVMVGGVSPTGSYNPQAAPAHAFTLPTGMWPGVQQFFSGIIPVAAATVVAVRIDTDGKGYIIGGTTNNITTGLTHYMDGIHFHPGYVGAVPLS